MTTSARSANAASLPAFSRRHLMSAAPLAVVLGGGYGLPSSSGADDELRALEREWLAAVARSAEADRQLTEVGRLYDHVKPAEPEAVFWRDTDVEVFGDYKGKLEGWGPEATRRWRYDGMYDLAAIKEAVRQLRAIGCAVGSGDLASRKITRAEEILHAHEQWRKATRECWNSGMEDAERHAERAHDEEAEVRRRIVACPATTLAGVLIKARVGAHCFGDTPDQAEEQIRDAIEDASGSCVALSLLSDLARMAAHQTEA